MFSLKVIFLVTCLLLIGFSEQKTSKEFRRFTKVLPPRTKAILKQYHCNPADTKKKQRGSLESWTHVILHCANLDQVQIQAVRCDKNCVDPVSCKKYRKLKAVPVLREKSFGGNGTLFVDLPIACKCVPRKENNRKCKRNRVPRIGRSI